MSILETIQNTLKTILTCYSWRAQGLYRYHTDGETEVYGNVKRFDWPMTIRKSTIRPTVLFLLVGSSPFHGTQQAISGAVLSFFAGLSPAGTKETVQWQLPVYCVCL